MSAGDCPNCGLSSSLAESHSAFQVLKTNCTLRNFNTVAKSCLGIELDEKYSQNIECFKTASL